MWTWSGPDKSLAEYQKVFTLLSGVYGVKRADFANFAVLSQNFSDCGVVYLLIGGCTLFGTWLNLKGNHVSGFIQGHSVFPEFSLTKNRIKELMIARKSHPLVLHFDATGSLFESLPDNNTRVFYYALVLPRSE